jgi:hypothetical protein
LFARQYFLAAYHMEKKNPGIEAKTRELTKSTETAEIRYA